ncbi:MAG: BCCT family transporter [Wenzhouxiangella sp.]|nr:BCCT family transporter [Wenzhouxiangella sp.]
MSKNNDKHRDEELKQLEEVYETDYEIGQDNIRWLGLDLHNPVFIVSAVLILAFVLGALLVPEAANDRLTSIRIWIGETFDWLFLSAGSFFVLFCLVLILMPFGKLRIGGDEARPEFSYFAWFAMLFAAGMGIGLMFWSVAEPVGYFTEWAGTPLNAEGGSARAALGATMYHWGFHPWAVYGVVALALAFFSYNKGLPLTIRSTFYPLLGERVWGPIGDVIDTVAVLSTLFGLVTSLGLGAQQAASGMSFLFGVSGGQITQIIIIAGVTSVALVSVLRGIDGGVKVLSNVNLVLAGVLLLFVIIAGGLTAFFANFGTTVAGYAQYILPLSNPVGREDEVFYHSWTIFFWAWWISWSPFVGMFIGRVSYGRTVREFLIAVLIVPVMVTSVWMTAFGGGGIGQVVDQVGQLADGISNSSLALFQMLDNMPFTSITSLLAITLVLVFFITSSDSGSLVIDSITSGGKTDAPTTQRVFWVIIEGVLAAVLLSLGGTASLNALQAGAVSSGLPFTVVLLLVCVSLWKGLSHERNVMRLQDRQES